MTNFRKITVTPLSTAVGAEIGGVNIAEDLDDATIAEIRQALLEHLVIFFRDQDITNIERHKAFTKRFGELFVHPNFNMANPPMAAILFALEAPEWGGDTLFANQYMAYDTLSDGMKKMLSGLKAVHNDSRVAGPGVGLNAQRATKVREDADWRMTESAHPVVRTHPETGRKGLFLNGIYVHHFEGLTVEESAPLLSFLYDHSCRPEFTCRFRWRTGSVAFWDNRCVQHLAIHDNHEATRRMQRTQIQGDVVR
jgi:taurine dioxygenase